VVGAGPAGVAAALEARRLRPDAAVLLLDREAFPRDKPCGDGLGPQAVDELLALGAGGALDGYPPIRGLRLRSPSGREALGRPARPSHVVPRRVLDARLVALAAARGVAVARRRVRRLEQRDRAGLVVVDGDLAARAVVGADGANSAVRRLLGAAPNPDGATAVALRGYAPAGPDADAQLIAWVDEGWPAYVWWFPTGTGLANVGYGLLRSRLRGGRAALESRLARGLPAAAADPATLRGHQLPLSSWRPPPGHGRVLLAGDAASLVNPVSGEGIYYALASGRLAARAALTAPAAPLRAYRRLLAAAFGRHLRHAAVLARAVRSRTLAEAALAAAAADPAVFELLVEAGLGQARISPRLLAALPAGLLRRAPLRS
jgi:geranylgeranyl reductase family protein